jgi:hypothetical protein
MPGISQHHSSKITKALVIGHTGTGKTGALMSLAAAGYNLRVLDFDNGMDIIKNYASSPKSPYKIDDIDTRIQYITLTDKKKAVAGKAITPNPQVWEKTLQMLQSWKDPISGLDLGPVTTWGEKDVLVFDTLTMLASAAYNYGLKLNGALLENRSQNEARRDIGVAQSLLKGLLEWIKDDAIKCNVIMNSHITFNTEEGGKPDPEKQSMKEGWPSAVGRALGPVIPQYFNTTLICQAEGSGVGKRHWIHTQAHNFVNAKTSAPLSVQPKYPLGSGLADYFKAVRGE